jgi:hypothetical protein
VSPTFSPETGSEVSLPPVVSVVHFKPVPDAGTDFKDYTSAQSALMSGTARAQAPLPTHAIFPHSTPGWVTVFVLENSVASLLRALSGLGDYYPLLEVCRCPLHKLVAGCPVSPVVATCRRLTSEALNLYLSRKTSRYLSLRLAFATAMLYTAKLHVPHLAPLDPLVLKLLKDYFPGHVRDAAQDHAASVPPPPPSSVVHHTDKRLGNTRSDSGSSRARHRSSSPPNK